MIVDEDTHAGFLNNARRAVDKGILSPKILDFVPETYDPERLEYGKKFIRSLSDKVKSTLVVDAEGNLAERTGGFEKGDITPSMATAKIRKSEKGGPSLSSFGKMIAEMNALPEDDPTRKLYMEKLSSKGMVIEKGEDGSLVVKTNVPSSGENLTKPVRSQVQKDLLSANDSYRRMVGIANKFEPRFQELNTRFKALGTKWQEKLEGTPIDKIIGKADPEDKKLLEEYTSYRREAIEALNAYIKEITGAQMSEKEVKRLTKAMPHPGLGLFDGDSPTEFKSKLEDTMKSISRSIARLNYVRKKGLTSIEDVGLEAMDGIIDRRGEEMEAELRKEDPDITDYEMEKIVSDRLSKEFGLVF